MKIVVLSGGFCTERHVGLVSGSGVCRALREKGHQAIFVDMFMGLENYHGRLEDIFDAPDGLLEKVAIEESAPDLEAVRAARQDKSPSLLGKDVLKVCAADAVFLAMHAPTARMAVFRRRWIWWACPIPAPATWAAPWPWIRPSPSG